MISFPNCKINIGLFITAKREDGYHNLESIFYPVPLSDMLEIVENKSYDGSGEKAIFTSSGIDIPGDSANNLCLKAYHLLDKDFNLGAVKIHLHKKVPIGAGLGGGSSDASNALILLNKIFNLKLDNETLKGYARQLGSDCAFFIDNTPTYNYNKGDEFRALDVDLSSYYLILINPGIHISTAEAYSGVKPKPSQISLTEKIKEPIQTWKNSISNDFEESLFPNHPKIKEIKEQLYQKGAVYAAMSGSGSSVFGIFEQMPEEDGFEGMFSFVCKLEK